MNRLSIAVASFFSLCILAPIGCAAPTADGPDEVVGESQDELSAKTQLVGAYYSHAVPFGGFARLDLEANGTFSAKVDAAGRALCIVAPCLLPQKGTWSAAKVAGSLRLTLRVGSNVDTYVAQKQGKSLTLTRAGKSQTIYALDANACLDDSDCDAASECAPRMCLMYCQVNDPFCCGPSVCVPKAPPPPPSCFGAWLDQNGTCRTPADGVYPASCCAAPVTCGTTTCGAGEVCCNPLMNICTKPGEFCAQ